MEQGCWSLGRTLRSSLEEAEPQKLRGLSPTYPDESFGARSAPLKRSPGDHPSLGLIEEKLCRDLFQHLKIHLTGIKHLLESSHVYAHIFLISLAISEFSIE